MSSSFRSSFDKFRCEFADERALIVAMSSINNKATADLRSEYSQLLNVETLLCRLHYIAHARRPLSLDELLFPMRGIQPLALAASFNIFTKPNQKERYGRLIGYLKANTGLFAQILYFALLAPGNPSITVDEIHRFDEDDTTFFCFNTFPAIYNNFLREVDQIQGISLIEAMFGLHMELVGTAFGKAHQFLSTLVLSFFLATNPGPFFEPLAAELRDFLTDQSAVELQYQRGASVGLVRRAYWHKCVTTAVLLVKTMLDNADLLPTPARLLITRLCGLQAGDFPFVQLFVFDAMFCGYLENPLLSAHAVTMRDLCNVIRCTYPQSVMPSPVYGIVSENTFFSSLTITPLIEALKLERRPPQPLSVAVEHCDAAALFSPRDLHLLFHAVSLFTKFCDTALTEELTKRVFAGVTPPTSAAMDCVFLLQNWGDTGKSKVSVGRPPRDFDDLVDALATVNCAELKFETPAELAAVTLQFCTWSLAAHERLRVRETAVIADRLPDALARAQAYRAELQKVSAGLFTDLFSITFETERTTGQTLILAERLAETRVLPMLFELFPFDFDFSAETVFEAKATLARVFRAIEGHVVGLGLQKAHDALLQKAVMLAYVDQTDRMFDFQVAATRNEKKSEGLLVKYDQNARPISVEFSRFQSEMMEKAAVLFKRLGTKSPPSVNLKFALIAMELIGDFSDEAIKRAMGKSRNASVFTLSVFLRAYVTDPHMVSIMLKPNEYALVQRFMTVATALWEQIC
jgi:hypothetical protein